jgi:hypothetical protein
MTQEGGGRGSVYSTVHCLCTVGCLAEGSHSKKNPDLVILAAECLTLPDLTIYCNILVVRIFFRINSFASKPISLALAFTSHK